MPALWVPILVVALLAVIVLITAYVFSSVVLFSRRQPIVRTPAAYGMAYEDVTFESVDGLALRGWFIPADLEEGDDHVVILTHAMPFNRHGFVARNQGWLPLFKTDVDLLEMARALHGAGYGVLAFDFRNHGESDGGITGVGLTEYQDVLGAVAYVRSRFRGRSPQIGFVSFCMGANATMVALSEGKDRLADVRFLVAIQPVSASVFFRCYMRSVYTPLSLFLIPLVDRLVQWRGGFALGDMSPLRYARDIAVPTLYVQARDDPWTELTDVQGFYEATAGPKDLWLIEGIDDRFEAYNYVGQFPEKVLAFAGEHF